MILILKIKVELIFKKFNHQNNKNSKNSKKR
jgi:hypothetical protein